MLKSTFLVSYRGNSLVLIVLALLSSLSRVKADLLVILLESSKVLPCLRELALLHALSDIPVHEGTLGVHEIKLMVKPCPCLSDGRGVRQHANCPLDLGEVASRHHGRWLVVDANLEGAVRVFEGGVGGQDGVVRLHQVGL